MVKLSPLSPFAGLLPREVGSLRVTEVDPGPVHWIAPYRSGLEGTAEALGAAGFDWPAPNRWTGGASGRLVSVGPGQAFLVGAVPPEIPGAAVTDVSDGWAVAALEGPTVREVLARLVPVDLSEQAFGADATARTLVGHMSASVTRVGEGFEVMVFRSMAGTFVEEVERAARSVAARG
ncbi:sarcosine oxidase subunit gamma [Histidinibacterium aquaticum]|uniref:Sarcosine oxidase subunit gamma n=1 Tax=Histidinibacterium aquaticum TaxID=2613962 RepID=A0A5J5GPZ6_9RHOB|nr:sarcosine oxidase subunit gamma [Histidinibacterium aquaticum]KAA9010250.1 sarcosine oxidase subunit gamma [Histidinibacterium aquaticum]